jgi:hypothetical protein
MLSINKSIFGLIFLIGLASPFIFWNEKAVFVAVFLIPFVFYRKSIYSIFSSTNKFVFLIFFVLFYLSVFLPFRPYSDFRFYNAIVAIGSIFVFFIGFKERRDILDGYITFMSWVSLGAILSFILFILKIPFPSVEISNEARDDHTYLYFATLYMDSQVNVFSGITFTRVNGVFKEPGHFGVFLSIAFSLIQKPLSSKRGKTILLGSLVTLSAATYLLIMVSLLIKYFRPKYTIYFSLFVSLLFLLSFIPTIQSLFDYYFLSKVSSEEGLLDGRTRNAGLYLSFLPNFYDYFIGTNNDFLINIARVTSDYRRIIYDSGYLVVIMSFILFLVFTVSSLKNRNLLLLNIILVLFLTLLHRSWFFYQGFFWFFVAIILAIIADNKKTQIKENFIFY